MNSASSHPPPPSREVIKRAIDGDAGAFEIIVQRYERAAFSLAYKMCHDQHLAADVVQEVFLQLYRKLHRYDLDRPFTPWFFRLATNMSINALKLKRHRRTRVLSELSDPDRGDPAEQAVAPDPGAAQALQEQEQSQVLRQLVASLPEKYAAIVSLRYLKELSVEDIAETLKMPLGTVKVRLFRARDLLRRRLQERGLLM